MFSIFCILQFLSSPDDDDDNNNKTMLIGKNEDIKQEYFKNVQGQIWIFEEHIQSAIK